MVRVLAKKITSASPHQLNYYQSILYTLNGRVRVWMKSSKLVFLKGLSMKLQFILPIVGTLFVIAAAPAQGAVLFADDFEDGTLDAWHIDGRQLQGTNIANVVTHNSSQMGHVYKTGFSEVWFETNYAYDANLRFEFDMEANASSPTGSNSNIYADAGAYFAFVDQNDTVLGWTAYLRTTSTWPLVQFDTPIHSYNTIADDAMHSYDIGFPELLANNPGINPADVASVKFLFRGYASGSSSDLQAEVFVDNVVVTPEPSTGVALFLGTLLALRRRHT